MPENNRFGEEHSAAMLLPATREQSTPKLDQSEAPLASSLDRRQFLRLAGGTLVSVSALGLIGCGGAGSGAPGQNVSPGEAKGYVQFPKGFQGNLNGLSVQNGLGSATVAQNLSFRTRCYPGGPSFVGLFDKTGALLLCGFVDPASNANVLNVASTATALIYYAINGPLLVGHKDPVLEYIETHQATETLASNISQRILASPTAIDSLDPHIVSAVNVAVATITGGSHPAYEARTAFSQPVQRDVPPSLIISPTGPQIGGLEVDPTGDNTGFTVLNTFRTERRMFVFKTSDTVVIDGKSVTTTLPSPLLVSDTKGLIVSGAAGLATIQTVLGLVQGNIPWLPTTSAKVPIAVAKGDKRTTYDLIVISPSFAADSPIFSDPGYSAHAKDWLALSGFLGEKTLVTVLFLPIMLDFVGFGFLNLSEIATPLLEAATDTFVGAVLGIPDPDWQAAFASLISGGVLGYPGFVYNIFYVMVNKPATVLVPVFTAMEFFLATLAISIGPINLFSRQSVIKVLGLVSKTLDGADFALVAGQLALSHPADVWNITIGDPTPLTISPQNPTLLAGSSNTFTVTPPLGLITPPNQEIVYDWTVEGSNCTFQDSGVTVTTTVGNVAMLIAYGAKWPSSGTITVTGSFLRQATGKKTSFSPPVSTTFQITGDTTIVPTVQFFEMFIGAVLDRTLVLVAIGTYTPIKGAGPDTQYSWTAPAVEGHVTTSEIFQGDLGLSPSLNMGTDFNAQLANAPGGNFNMGGGLYGLFGGYVSYVNGSGGDNVLTLAQAKAYLSGIFAKPPAIHVKG